LKINNKRKMRKLIVLTAVVATVMFLGCGDGDKVKKTDGPTEEIKTTAVDADAEKGLSLVGASDCLTCHKIAEQHTGPSYNQIALKYENNDANQKMIAQKIVKGGSGVWGSIPMLPHPQISEADALLMAKYVLSLRELK
jgi:cytochrome c